MARRVTAGGSDDEVLLDEARIRACLERLADKLEQRGTGHQLTVVVAGGSCLALMGLRDSTVDVDAVNPLDPAVRQAAREVAVEEGLPVTWLNTSALAWKPQGLEDRDCFPLIDRAGLRVVGVPPSALFLMKLNRASESDQADMRRLWPLCTFKSIEQVVAEFDAAYPAQEPDEYLADFVRQLVQGNQ